MSDLRDEMWEEFAPDGRKTMAQKDLAKAMGVSPMTVSRVLHAHFMDHPFFISAEFINAFCKALSVGDRKRQRWLRMAERDKRWAGQLEERLAKTGTYLSPEMESELFPDGRPSKTIKRS